MKAILLNRTALLSFVAAAALLASGCGQQASQPSGDSTPVAATGHEGHSHDDPSHGGWWCVEHGVPEAECSLCSKTAAKKFKAQGDWCEEHNRADSQCFICHPEKAEKFAQLYEAKYGRQPPKPEDE